MRTIDSTGLSGHEGIEMSKYQATVRQNGVGGNWIAIVTYEDRVRELKHYATQKNAERAAAKMLAQYRA
jgi:hypothetical protein